MFETLRRWFRRPSTQRWIVDAAAGGYRIGPTFVARGQIVRITAWKEDLLTIDSMILGIEFGPRATDGRHRTECLAEEHSDYEAVLADLEAHFALAPEWWKTVVFPAFARNRTVLWTRDP